ncbi:transcriptional regulator of arginine metabolism [Candidatus Hakubella thermalkaliphila]|uniref:Arginine repressor n=2 Tax=Candidatus Hakubella thermalkaliphila TaxID=2754717 RepID=A0A6V8NVB0_9ACTN|nr:arginine repressor [Candidatus Hakubella thermalkaliphila]MBT9171502.1 Arginine repressor [Actinomycetota bacterium]GFP24198.1 transcriptional regulator of arginine metabolism [Candidatus Hakubella thermalkaliphila]GFP24796.1 transcriptional regulator of arginine metabolism [Candidatus Hakubella thermalkaliphila]GFP27135.1 transcriptional regulator of arginine metabolism [Candidatus Hakubella thermalkaliphila]GFP31093.1 transcriptional regulator of arginine metabolism [Candidatus Hakubella 
MARKERLRIIQEIVAQNKINTQEELARKLAQVGIEVSQATISRDIKSLGLAKIKNRDGKVSYAIESTNRLSLSQDKLKSLRKRVEDSLISAEVVMNQVVIKTTPGSAHSLAAAIDDIGFSQVVGTLAGDDTILVISRNNEEAQDFYHKLLSY